MDTRVRRRRPKVPPKKRRQPLPQGGAGLFGRLLGAVGRQMAQKAAAKVAKAVAQRATKAVAKKLAKQAAKKVAAGAATGVGT